MPASNRETAGMHPHATKPVTGATVPASNHQQASAATILGFVQLPKRIRLPHDAYTSPEHVFHLVLHAFPDTQPFQDQALGDAIWALVLAERNLPTVHLIAACLMPDHLHLLASPRERDIIGWMRGFKSYSTRISWEFTRRKVLWQPSYFDRRIRDEAELEAVLGYIVRNPENAGLVDATGSWRWLWGLVAED